MIFNSYEYLIFFVLTFVLGWSLSRQKGITLPFILLSSLIFYTYGEWIGFLVLASSVLINFCLGRALLKNHPTNKKVLTAGVVFNLLILGYFKYKNFFLGNILAIAGKAFEPEQLILPLAISFFTFQQIAFLVDVYKGKVKSFAFLDYVVFVSFFPQLIAGPIVHYREVSSQIKEKLLQRFQMANAVEGIALICIGLAKKVLIADSLKPFVDPVFAYAESSANLWTIEAWGACIAYTFQLYFDFSGYVDIALGSALLLGVRLPLNFQSPYKSSSIIDFWRRWHITLSNFLRDYLYIPLGGSRDGSFRKFRNIFATMLLGGLWHGAGWNFVIWGAWHGSGLCINHGLRGLRAYQRIQLPKVVAVSTTFIFVLLGWVFFRADTFVAAKNMIMALNPLSLLEMPTQLRGILDHSETRNIGLTFEKSVVLDIRYWIKGAAIILFAGIISFFAPSSDIVAKKIQGFLETRRPILNTTLGFAFGLLFTLCATQFSRVHQFIYFRF